MLVAFHDDHLDRVTDGSGAIADLPWSVVGAARVDGREPIPRFEDLLTAWPDVRINVDPKHDGAVEPLAEVLVRTGAVDRVCIGAFSDRRIARVQALVGPVALHLDGPTPGGPAGRARPAGSRPGARAPRPACRCPPTRARCPSSRERFVDAAHRRGIQVHVWTIDDPAEMARLLDLGVDGLMTDRPQELKDLLVARGEWVT